MDGQTDEAIKIGFCVSGLYLLQRRLKLLGVTKYLVPENENSIVTDEYCEENHAMRHRDVSSCGTMSPTTQLDVT